MTKNEAVETKDRKKAIDKEVKRLQKLFTDIPERQKKLCEGVIHNSAFLRNELEELQEDIIQNGSRIEGLSGNGFMTSKDNPSLKALASLTAQYNSSIKLLVSLLPLEMEKEDELTVWLKENGGLPNTEKDGD